MGSSRPTGKRNIRLADVAAFAMLLAWTVIALLFHDEYYNSYAIVASAVILAGALGFYRWEAPEGREGYRLLGFFVCAQAFLSSGLSVLNRVDTNSLLGTPTEEAFSFAVVSTVIFAIMFLLGALATAPAKGKSLPDAPTAASGPSRWVALLLAGSTGLLIILSLGTVGESLGTLPLILVNIGIIAPMLAAQPFISGRRTGLAVTLLLLGQATAVFYTSMIGFLILPMRDMVLARVYLRKRLPLVFMASMIAVAMVLNPVKHLFRNAIGAQGTSGNFDETFSLWSDAMATTWSSTGHGPTNRAAGLESSSSRLDYNWISAHVYRSVPRKLPFELGGTYAPIATILIPRVIYPDKPDSGYYARGMWMIKLGVQTRESSKSTSFALPAPAEAYWNFGWLGVFVIPTFLGALVGLVLRFGPKDPVVRVGYAVLLATKLGQFLDMIVWVIPAFVAVITSGLVTSLYCRIGKGFRWIKRRPAPSLTTEAGRNRAA